MKFWDSSAVVPLLIDEPASAYLRSLASSDPEFILSFHTAVEVTSAIQRLIRGGHLSRRIAAECETSLGGLLAVAVQVLDVVPVVSRARALLARHLLTAGDAMQLAAALVACGDAPADLPFVTLDDRLAEAAALEGFAVEARN